MPVRTHTPTQEQRTLPFLNRDVALIALAAIIAVLLTTTVTAPPATVDRLTIRNDTPWHLSLTVGTADTSDRTALPIVLAGSTNAVADVLDQGDDWIVEVRVGGVDAATIEVTRGQLQAAGWELVIPDSAARRLEAAGVDLPAD